MMPRSRIEDARLFRSNSLKFFRGLRGLGRMNSIGTLRCPRERSDVPGSSPTSPINAASPRPSPRTLKLSSPIVAPLGCLERSFALDDLGCEFEVGLRARAFQVVEQHRLAVRRRLGHAHIARNHGLVDLVAHELTDVRNHL